jgi:hypothetical protein
MTPSPRGKSKHRTSVEQADDDDRLWHVRDVARFLGVSPRTVYDLPGLPAIRLKGRGQRRIRRYVPAKVRQWALARADGVRAAS